MTVPVRQRLEESLATASAAGRAVAGTMLAHFDALPFETSATIAAKAGVSELTVGRFCRSIGYRSLKDLKRDLAGGIGDSPWLIGDRLRAFHARSQEEGPGRARTLEREIAALVRVHELAEGADFARAVRRLAHAERVHVAGFQTERGVAAILAHQLQYLRDGVHLADLSGGSFAEVLLGSGDQAVVIFEARRYSRQALLLAERAADMNVPVILVTDPYCDWGARVATELFQVPTDVDLFWDSAAPMISLVHLLLNGVFTELGPAAVEARLAAFAALYQDFVGHTDAARGGRGRRNGKQRPKEGEVIA